MAPGRESRIGRTLGPTAGGPARLGRAVLTRQAAIELALTGVLLFVVVTAVRWTIGEPAVVRGVGSVRGLVAVVAAVAAATIYLIIVCPWGRRSGAHVNPAVTVGLWVMRAFPAGAVPAYVGAQLSGGLLGCALARLVWGDAVSAPPVSYAVVRPAAEWVDWEVASAEAGCLVLVTLIIGFFLAHPDMRLPLTLPAVLAVTTFAITVGLGQLSGAGTNPARALGPAVLAGSYDHLAAYLLAPVVGAVVGGVIHLRLVRDPVRTYKLAGGATAGDGRSPGDS